MRERERESEKQEQRKIKLNTTKAISIWLYGRKKNAQDERWERKKNIILKLVTEHFRALIRSYHFGLCGYFAQKRVSPIECGIFAVVVVDQRSYAIDTLIELLLIEEKKTQNERNNNSWIDLHSIILRNSLIATINPTGPLSTLHTPHVQFDLVWPKANTCEVFQ